MAGNENKTKEPRSNDLVGSRAAKEVADKQGKEMDKEFEPRPTSTDTNTNTKTNTSTNTN